VTCFFLYPCLLLILTLLSAACSSSETAFFSLPISRTSLWRNSSDARKQNVASLLSHSQHLLVLIFILNTIVNVLLQNTSSELSELAGGGWLFTFLVPLTLILIFGEFLPKYLGLVYSESFALKVAPVFIFLEKLFLPLQKAVTAVANILSRMLFFFLKHEPPLARKELESILLNCEEKGILSQQEAIFIHSSLDFDSKQAREIMTPRSSTEYLPLQTFTLEKAKEFVQRTRKNAILIVDETPDKPLGALSGLEALIFAKDHIVEHIKKNIFYAPESTSTHRLLQDFSTKQAKIACIVDEHGTISGFVNRDDLSKQLLGFHSKKSVSTKLTDSSLEKTHVFPGTSPLSIINELYNKQLTSRYHNTTLGGWLMEQLDSIPQVGTCYEFEGLEFRVVLASAKAIEQVFIQKSRQASRGAS
jgi:putative hemolysin